jgi:acyl-CoA synthetase (AMP-forming)/AMP-acid ligase II
VTVDPSSTAALYFTSGTTGVPKGVVRSHRSHIHMALGYLAMMPVLPDDAVFYAFPLTSAAFYGLAVPAWFAGAPLVLQREFDAPRLVRDLVARGITHTAMAPTMWERLLAARADTVPARLRYAAWGGAPIRAATVERLASWLPVPVGGVYGLTEATCLTACVGNDAAEVPTSCGRPTAVTTIRIVDAERRPLPPGATGEVEISSLVSADGYLEDPRLTAELFADGWFRTGDLGSLDEQGRLFVVDRVKDLIISGGENIYPAEIENVVGVLPGVREVCAIGVPDDRWGESVCLFVAPEPGRILTAEEVRAGCAAGLARFKLPRTSSSCRSCPRTRWASTCGRRSTASGNSATARPRRLADHPVLSPAHTAPAESPCTLPSSARSPSTARPLPPQRRQGPSRDGHSTAAAVPQVQDLAQ